MHCPFCAADDTRVVDSRLSAEGSQVRRRRECTVCGERFTTFETAELVLPRIIKANGMRQPFDEEKLRASMVHALQKRPIALEKIDDAILRIRRCLRTTGERDVKSCLIGELVMNELKKLDAVAYVRFASVHYSFQDINEFRAEIDKLERDTPP